MFKKLLTQVGLGGLPSSFGFTVGDKVELPFTTLWSLHKGQSRSDGTPVSVFVYSKKDHDAQQQAAAKNAERLGKSLRHPNVLRALDSCDTEDALYLVTEAVVPLLAPDAEAADDSGSKEPAVLGLYQALDALSFLHQSGFAHGLFGPAAIFVTPRGDYRLGGFELARKGAEAGVSLSAVRRCGPGVSRWPEPPSSLEASGMPSIAFDLWGATLLEAYVFGTARSSARGSDFHPDMARAANDVPKELRKSFSELQAPGALKGKSPVAELIALPFFQDHPAVSIMLFLSSLHIKSAEEKEQFFESLPAALDGVPRIVQTKQVLPELLQAQKFPGQEGAHVLPSILKIAARLDSAEFKEKVAPLVVQLFTSPDRAIRFRLLSSIGDMIDFLDDSMINDKIFPECVNGFTDSNAPIREATVKSLIFFVPRLKAKLLESRVVKLLLKLLQDPEPSIRTNTVICCGRISSHMTQAAACQMLMQALSGGMKDPFAPCRSATLHTLLATANLFSNSDLAARLLPIVCERLVDPDPSVGDTAFDVLASLQTHLRQQVTESRAAAAQSAEAAAQAGGAGGADGQAGAAATGQAGAWGSWMSTVGSAMGSKIMGSMTSKGAGSNDNIAGSVPPPPTGSATSTGYPSTQQSSSSVPSAATPSSGQKPPSSSPKVEDSPPAAPGGGWDEDSFWDDFGDVPPPTDGGGEKKVAAPTADDASRNRSASAPAKTGATDGWSSKEDDDFWKEFDIET